VGFSFWLFSQNNFTLLDMIVMGNIRVQIPFTALAPKTIQGTWKRGVAGNPPNVDFKN